MKIREWAEVVVAVLLCEAIGSLGALFTMPAIPTWYAGLVKPELTPPAWVFGPVWTTLFALMGISLWLVWKERKQKRKAKQVKVALQAFGGQFVLNVLWSFLFFGLQSPLYGLVCIAALWLAIAFTIAKFWPVSKPAAWLLVPYLGWVTVASYLNYSVWLLN